MKKGLALLGLLCAVAGCADRDRKSVADGLLVSDVRELDFGSVSLHNWNELTVTVTNMGRGPLALQEIWTEGPEGTFKASFVDEAKEHQLATGDSATVRVKFTPKADGDLEGNLVFLTDNRSEPRSKISLRGHGIDARATITAGRFDFGRIEADSTKSLPFVVENKSIIPVDVMPRALGVDKDEFASEAVVLAPGEKRTLQLAFNPTRVGKKVAAFAVAPCRGCGDELFDVRAEALDRAIVAQPAEVDLGQIPIDRTVEGKLRLMNLSTEPVEISSMALAATTDPSFTADTASFPATLNGGEAREWTVRYSPGHMGIAEGQAVFNVKSKRNPTTPVAVRAFGGSPELCISPLNYDFGKVPVGAKLPLTVNIKNCGSSNGDPLQVTELVFGGTGPKLPGEDQFNLAPGVTLPRTLAAGEEMTAKIYFEPTRAGAAAATLNVRSTAYAAAHLKVGFSGTAEQHAPCTVAVTPGAIDFGNVPPSRGAVLGVKVENRGMDLCAVKNIQMSETGGGVFRLPGGALDGFILNPGSFFSFMVAFNPPVAGGSFTGAVQVEPADPANPVVLIPLTANSQKTCVSLAPPFLDFGVTRPDCPAAPLKTNISNSCSTPITLDGVAIGAGTTDGEFTVSAAPGAMPFLLNPGDAVSVEIAYQAQVRGMNLSPLYLRVSGEPHPLLVPLVGESSSKAEQTDRFVQQDGSKVDVLFVVDNTASMVEEHPRLVAAVPSFVNEALARHVDLHVAVTTTGIETASPACPGGAQGGEAGRFFPVDGTSPRVLTQNTPNLASVLAANVQVGQCAFVEKGFEAVRRALSSPLVDGADDPRTPQKNDGNQGFLRDEAALAVVFVGDEDDHSPDDVDTYVKFLQTKKGANQPQRATIYAIAPTDAACATAGGTGTRYDQAATKTGGEVLSVCAADYAPLLQSLAAKAFSPQDRFPLSSQPDTTSIAVKVNGAPAASGWSYDAAGNAVVFSPKPQAGSKVEVTYRKVCPH